MRVLVITLLAFAWSISWAQQDFTVRGWVKLQSSGSKPLKGVTVSVGGCANPQVTNDDGSFALLIRPNDCGHYLTFVAKKNRYEVVNTKQLENVAVVGKDTREITIVMCREGTWTESALRHYGIAEEIFNKDLKRLEDKIKVANKGIDIEILRDSLQIVKQRWHDNQDIIKNLSNKFASIDLDDVDSLYRKAFQAYNNQHYDVAIKILTRTSINNQIGRGRKELDRIKMLRKSLDSQEVAANKALKNAINSLSLKADIFSSLFNWDSARYYYEQAAQEDTTSYEHAFSLATFLAKLNYYSPSHKWFNVAMRNATNDFEKYAVYNNIGILHSDESEREQAANAYNQALAHVERLASTNPSKYEIELCMTLNNLGTHYAQSGHFTDAETSLKRAISLREKWIQQYPEDNSPTRAILFNNLAELYLKVNDFPRAEEMLKKSIKICETLSKLDYDRFAQDEANAHSSLGSLAMRRRDFGLALEEFKKALAINEDLAKKNPRIYDPYVAISRNDLGQLFAVTRKFKESEMEFEKALQMYTMLSRINDRHYKKYVGQTQANLASLYLNTQRFAQAEAALKSSVETFASLVSVDGPSYWEYYAESLRQLGDYYLRTDNYEMAIQSYDKALEIFKSMETHALEYDQSLLAELYGNISNAWEAMGNEPRQEENLTDALRTWRSIADRPVIGTRELYCDQGLKVVNWYRSRYISSLNKKYKERALTILSDLDGTVEIIEGDERIVFKSRCKKFKDFFTVISPSDLSTFHFIDSTVSLGVLEQDPDHLITIENLHKVISAYRSISSVDTSEFSLSRRGVYGSLSYHYLFAREFVKSEKAALSSLELNTPEMEWVNSNLAIALLFQGRYPEAKLIYSKFRGMKYNEEKTWDQVFIEDLDALKQQSITHPDCDKIRKLLSK